MHLQDAIYLQNEYKCSSAKRIIQFDFCYWRVNIKIKIQYLPTSFLIWTFAVTVLQQKKEKKHFQVGDFQFENIEFEHNN